MTTKRKIQVCISVIRKVEYATIVRMTRKEFNAYRKRLDSNIREERKSAENELNNMIDTNDWQYDELHLLLGLEEVKLGDIT